MDRSPQTDNSTYDRQNQSWNDPDNFGGQSGNLHGDQNPGMQGDFGGTNDFDRTRMATSGTAQTARVPGGVFASHGGQLGAEPTTRGGDFNNTDAGPTMGAQGAGAGRDDPFASSAPNFRGGPGPAIPGGGAAGSGEQDDMSGAGASTGNPGMGNKFVGRVEKAAGRVTGSTNLAEHGQMRKTGEPQADDTLL